MALTGSKRTAAAGLALFAANLTLATPAAAQACRIAPNADGWTVGWAVGGVSVFGDLRIRVAEFITGNGADPVVIADIKAPGFLQSGVRLVWGKPVKFIVCGEEVTVTYDSGRITVGVF